MHKQRLAIPGPTHIPERVLAAMARQPINHRGHEFRDLLYSVTAKLQRVFQTENPVYIFTSSGTGVMEGAISNCFSRGDKVLYLVNGAFGERFVDIGQCYDLEIERMDFEWGSAISVDEVSDRLSKDKKKKIKGVLFQHNETSTGVLNNASGILTAIGNHGALSIVDSISGLVAAHFNQDEFGADVVLSASQKGFMMPPGLAFMSVSGKARKAIARAGGSGSAYFSIPYAEASYKKGQTYSTPAVNLMFGLSEALDMIFEEGLDECQWRHEGLKNMARKSMQAMGLELLVANDHEASPAITTVKMDKEYLNALLSKARENGVELASGQEKLKGKIFRIAHLGYVDEMDLLGIIYSIEFSLHLCGFPDLPERGEGVAVAARSYIEEITLS